MADTVRKECAEMAMTLTREEFDRMTDEFFGKRACDRCGGLLRVRTMSWFTQETICGICSEKEMAIRKRLRAQGKDPADYENCGRVPEV